jgi:hypothetical protein
VCPRSLQIARLVREIQDWGGLPFDPQEKEAVAEADRRNRARVDKLAETLPRDSAVWDEFPKDTWGMIPVIDGIMAMATGMQHADMIRKRHRGELKEISHVWMEHHGTIPSRYNTQWLFLKQFDLTDRSFKDKKVNQNPEKINVVLYNDRQGSRYFTRKSQVCGIGDLWHAFGRDYSAKVLYEAYESFPTLVLKYARG